MRRVAAPACAGADRQAAGAVHQAGADPARKAVAVLDRVAATVSDLVGEEIGVDILGNAEIPDTYWADGWLVGFCDAKRVKFDFYDGHYWDAYPTRYRLPDSPGGSLPSMGSAAMSCSSESGA